MTLTLIPAAVFAATVFNIEAESLPYFDPPPAGRPSWSYAFTGAGSIPRELNEKLLLFKGESHSVTADSLIALVNQEYSLILQELRGLVAETLGIAEEYDTAKESIPEPKSERPPYIGYEYPPWPPLGEGLAFIRKDSQSSPPPEYELTSQPYNKLESINGFSEVRIRVSDGRQLVGRAVTILQIRRRDYSREWARVWHLAIPLPYKEDRAFTVVTNTEVALIEKLKKRVPGLAVRYFVPASGYIEIDKEAAKSLLTSMLEAVKQLESK